MFPSSDTQEDNPCEEPRTTGTHRTCGIYFTSWMETSSGMDGVIFAALNSPSEKEGV